MGCYCSEIRECRYDIDQVESAKEKIPDLEAVNEKIMDQLKAIAGLCDNAFQSSAMGKITYALNEMKTPVKNKLEEEKRHMAEAIRQIRETRSDYSSDDDYYHSQDND